MAQNRKRPTLKDVAALAGVSHTAVSLALRSHPSIPPKTRTRILEAARTVGYRPDPMLSSLAAYRSSIHKPVFQATLAWVTNHETRDGWRRTAQLEGYYKGAKARAESLGFQLEEFWLRESGMTARRASEILRNRGISGLLMASQEYSDDTVELDWKQFSAVTLGHTIAFPSLHLVMNHQYRNMSLLLSKLHKLGYHRIGFAMEEEAEHRTDHHYLGAYHVIKAQSPAKDHIPLLLPPKLVKDAFINWVRSHPVEVVITSPDKGYTVCKWLQEEGLRVPEDIGVAMPSIPYGDNYLSGIEENVPLVGTLAVDLLVAMLKRSECGIPKFPQNLLIEGIWQRGKTVRNIPAC